MQADYTTRQTIVSDRLYMIAGVLEKFQATGGAVSAGEIQWLVAQLSSCAEQARADVLHACWMADQLEEAIDLAHPVPNDPNYLPPAPGLFDVIQGGRA